MQCVQCWNEIKKCDIKCPTCNEIFCSQSCLDEHTKDVQFKNEMMDFQDEYREANEPFRYWEKI